MEKQAFAVFQTTKAKAWGLLIPTLCGLGFALLMHAMRPDRPPEEPSLVQLIIWCAGIGLFLGIYMIFYNARYTVTEEGLEERYLIGRRKFIAWENVRALRMDRQHIELAAWSETESPTRLMVNFALFSSRQHGQMVQALETQLPSGFDLSRARPVRLLVGLKEELTPLVKPVLFFVLLCAAVPLGIFPLCRLLDLSFGMTSIVLAIYMLCSLGLITKIRFRRMFFLLFVALVVISAMVGSAALLAFILRCWNVPSEWRTEIVRFYALLFLYLPLFFALRRHKHQIKDSKSEGQYEKEGWQIRKTLMEPPNLPSAREKGLDGI